MAVTLDDVINTLGFGRFSWMLLFVSGMLWVSESSEVNLISLIAPEMRCVWNLSSLQTSFTSCTVFVGQGIGSLVWGYLGDKYGRKSVMVVASIVILYFGLLSSLAPSFAWFLILRFFAGIGLGVSLVSPCYVAEFIVTRHRGKSVITLDMFYALGSFYISIVALLLMNTAGWRIFLVATAIPVTIFLLMSPWLPESIRYLENAGEYDKMMKVLHRISAMNNAVIPCITKSENKPVLKRGNMAVMFSNEYRWKFTMVTILFITSYIGYYGLVLLNTEILQSGGFCIQNATSKTFECHKLKNNDYLQNILVVSAEFPGILLPALTIDVIGRKKFIFPAFVFSGIGFLCMNYCFSRVAGTVLMFVMRAVLTGLSQTPYLLSSELFPTAVRTSATGLSLTLCKFSLIAVPFLVQVLYHVSLAATTIVFASLCFVGAVAILLLPETKDKLLSNN